MLSKWFRREPVEGQAPEGQRIPIVTEPAYVPEVTVDGVEMAVSIRRLAAMFVEQGWTVALDGERPREATPDAIKLILAGHLHEMVSVPDATYTTGFRFLTIRDKDYGDDLDLYLYVGRATTTPEVSE